MMRRELRKTPSLVFIGERNCGKSSIINKLLKQTNRPVHVNPCSCESNTRMSWAQASFKDKKTLKWSQAKAERIQSFRRYCKGRIKPRASEKWNRVDGFTWKEPQNNHCLLVFSVPGRYDQVSKYDIIFVESGDLTNFLLVGERGGE